MKPIIVIPAYNEARIIGHVVQSVRNAGYPDVIVVDDGSNDNTMSESEVAGAHVLSHCLNRGKGVAAKTGIEAALGMGCDIVVVMDGDGQHDAANIAEVIAPISRNECEVVFGVRPFDTADMPKSRIVFNHLGNLVTSVYAGAWISDSQSGFRAFSRRAADMIDTVASQYEYETEVIREIVRHKLSFVEVPITVRYTEYSMRKEHGQGITSGARTMYRMIWNRLSL